MWESLNKRQQQTLKLIYDQDQRAEKDNQGSRFRWNRTPANQWRWLRYGPSDYSILYARMREARLVDQGTGSTFSALERRGLIRVKTEIYMTPLGPEAQTYVQLTKVGRKLVRDSLSFKAATKWPAGQLREWHWRALTLAYVAGEAGCDYHFGGVSWPTWLRLRDYKIAGHHADLIHDRRRIYISALGIAYYQRVCSQYKELYPKIEVPQMEALPDPFSTFEIPTGECVECGGQRVEIFQQLTMGKWKHRHSEQSTCACERPLLDRSGI